MRSHPSCWNKTLAQLGFWRKRRKAPKRQDHTRRSLFESLEQRQMLSSDPLFDLESIETAATSDLPSKAIMAFSASEPEFVLVQAEAATVESLPDSPAVEEGELEPAFAVETVRTDSGPKAVLFFNPKYAGPAPSALQELQLELREAGRVLETYDILIDIAEEDFREQFLADRVKSAAAGFADVSHEWLHERTTDKAVIALGEVFENFIGPLTLKEHNALIKAGSTKVKCSLPAGVRSVCRSMDQAR